MSVTVRIDEGPLPATPPAWSAAGAGALLCFEGVVRPEEAERPIAALDYQVYEPMASTQLHRLAHEILTRFGLIGVFVEHSRGRVPNGACSFRLRVASAHRKEGLAAMDHFIDRLKQDVPIWKNAVFRPEAKSLREGMHGA